MTTEQQLREALDAHVEQAPGNGDRIGQVRSRVRARRQRRAAGASLALAVVAAAVAVPLTAADRGGGPTRLQPVAIPTVTPSYLVDPPVLNPEYTNGGHKLGGAEATTPGAGSLTYTFTPTSYRLFLTTSCVTTAGTTVSVTVNGHPTMAGGCATGSTSGAGNPADPVGSNKEWAAFVHLGRPNTVVVTQVAGVTRTLSGAPLPPAERPAGTFASAMYQAIPAEDYPLPARPEVVSALQPNGLRPIVLDSRRVGADGTSSFAVTIGARTELDVVGVAPGEVALSVDGHTLSVSAFWSYVPQGTAGIQLDPASLRQDGITARLGQRLTVAVAASRVQRPVLAHRHRSGWLRSALLQAVSHIDGGVGGRS